MTKGEEFLISKREKERKFCAVNVARIQVLQDDCSDKDSIYGDKKYLGDWKTWFHITIYFIRILQFF